MDPEGSSPEPPLAELLAIDRRAPGFVAVHNQFLCNAVREHWLSRVLSLMRGRFSVMILIPLEQLSIARFQRMPLCLWLTIDSIFIPLRLTIVDGEFTLDTKVDHGWDPLSTLKVKLSVTVAQLELTGTELVALEAGKLFKLEMVEELKIELAGEEIGTGRIVRDGEGLSFEVLSLVVPYSSHQGEYCHPKFAESLDNGRSETNSAVER